MSIHKGEWRCLGECVSVGRPEAWRQGIGTPEHRPGYPKKGYRDKEAHCSDLVFDTRVLGVAELKI